MNNQQQTSSYHYYEFGNTHIVFVEQHMSTGLNHMYALDDFAGLVEIEASDDKWFAIHPLDGSFNVVTTNPVVDVQNALNDLYEELDKRDLLKDFFYKAAKNKMNKALELMRNVG